MTQLPLQVVQYTRPRTIEERFLTYCEKHPEVEGMIVGIARQLKAQGRRKYSMDAIFHRLRWHYTVERAEDDFKLNNDYTAMYARKIEDRYPDLRGFFEKRERKAV